MTTAPEQSPLPGDSAQQRTAERRNRNHAFTQWVEELCAKDPGARSALRSGLRKDLGKVPRMHKFVAPWLPEKDRSEDTERAYYTIAAMIASQPRTGSTTAQAKDEADTAAQGARYGSSLGTALALAVVQAPGREREMRENTAESALHLLTRQSVSGLHRRLPSSVGYLRELGVSVDWPQLLDDLMHWRRHSGRVSRRWLQDFYQQRTRSLRDQADQQDADEAVLAESGEPATG